MFVAEENNSNLTVQNYVYSSFQKYFYCSILAAIKFSVSKHRHKKCHVIFVVIKLN